MTNNKLLKKLSEDMKMRNFSHYTHDAYMGKTREMIKYFNKPMEKITMEYVHVANIDLGLESPLDVLMRGARNGKDTRNIK